MNARKLRIEPLEERRMLATFTVTNLANSGTGSLRQAILSANATPTVADNIIFSAAAQGTITLTTGELSIIGPLTITGTATFPSANSVTIDANHLSRIFNIDNPSSETENFNVTFANLTLINGHVAGEGGAIRSVTSGTVRIENSTISGSNAVNFFDEYLYGIGGGVSSYHGSLELVDSNVSNNNAYYGGGISKRDGNLTVTRSTIQGNTSDSAGGIEFIATNLEITDSTISNNTAAGPGGAIYMVSATATIKNSTLSGNSAFGGGAIRADNTNLSIINSTITENDSQFGGGILTSNSSARTLTLKNTIIAGNTAPSNPDIRASSGTPTTISATYSLIGNTGGLTAQQLLDVGNGAGNLQNVNPQLGPLTNNGGRTLTHALAGTSPALNAGNPADLAGVPGVPTFDQRAVAGFDRVKGGRIDMGAYEEQNVVAPIDADFDHDHDVDGRDFLLWQRGYPGTYGSTHLAAWEQQYALPVAISAISQDSSSSPFWILAPDDGETARANLSVIEEDAPVEAAVDNAFEVFGMLPLRRSREDFGDICASRPHEADETRVPDNPELAL